MTSLANRGTTEIEEYDYSGIDFESDGNEGIAPTFPSIKIVQATSQQKDASKHLGMFWHSDTELYQPSLDVVALLKRDTRAYFKEGEQEPACASNDGIAPRPNQPLWNGDQPALCAECPLSSWGDDGKPPACRESMVLLVDRSDGPLGEEPPDLAQLRIGGMSIRPYKRFVARKLAPKKLPIYTQSLHLTTVEKIEAGKKWFELVIENVPLARKEVEGYVGLLRAERARFAESISHDTDAAPESVWGDGKESFHRTPPVDADGVIQERRTPTPSPLSRTAAEMFPKVEQG